MPKKVVVIAGPSGSGKNTIIRNIKVLFPHTVSLTTVTTRAVRPGEVDGEDYHFWDIDRFDSEVGKGRIVGTRYAPLFGGVHYGIWKDDLQKKLLKATVIFAPVDVTGAEWLKEKYGALTIFITPESFEQYRSRIKARSPEMSEREFDMRMRIARTELSEHAPKFDYRVVSADGGLIETVHRVLEILAKEGYTL